MATYQTEGYSAKAFRQVSERARVTKRRGAIIVPAGKPRWIVAGRPLRYIQVWRARELHR